METKDNQNNQDLDRQSSKSPKVDEHSKNKQMEQYREDPKDQYMTTDHGVRINHTDDSLKAGPRGPLLMEDFHFREKMTHFDHESMPERVVHARGSGAHGYFQPYDDSMKEFTKARFLTDPNTKTPVFVRFSTVVGSRGSADTVRNVRGFATKFYTEEGNYDLVANNIPVFFIQDTNKFADLVHAIKPDPDNEMPQASAAHDTFWDFASLMPEINHMIMWLLSDRGIPRSFRMMDGFGVHTFRFSSANFGELPINSPIARTHNHQGAGFMRHTINKGKVNYWPNSIGGGCPMMAPENKGAYVHYMEKVDGHKIRARSKSFNDHYTQATLFWNSMTMPEKKHIVKAAHFELGKVESKEIRQRMLGHFSKVSMDFAKMVAEGIGVEVPKNFGQESTGNYEKDDVYKKMKNGKSVKETDFVSMEKNKIRTARSRKVAILIEDGYDYNEVMQVKQTIKDAGAHAKIVSKFHGMRKSSSGEEIEVDKSHITTGSIMYDAIYIPDGEKSIQALMKEGDALHFINEAFKHCKPIATSGNGILLLQKSSLIGIEYTEPGSGNVKSDKGIVTAGIKADATEFSSKFIDAIKEHRHWDREEKMIVPA